MSTTLKNEIERQKWLEKTLKKLDNNSTILDAGAGQLANKIFCSHLNYKSQDFCQYEGIGNSKGLQKHIWDTSKIDIISDICCIPLPDESFDSILCSEVLEHVPNPIEALKELIRILKPNGKLILTAPFCSLTHFAPYHFYSGFNRYFYEHHLKEMGMYIEELIPNGNYYSYLHQECNRVSKMEAFEKSLKFKFISSILTKAFKLCLKIAALNDDASSDQLLCFGYHVVATKK